MADAIVSDVLEQLTSEIYKKLREEVRLVTGVRNEINKLPSHSRCAVRGWLDKLKDASYDMDDVLDEWNTAILKLQGERRKAESKFEKRIWVCVSDPFDKIRVANEIIEGLDGQVPNLINFNSLLNCDKMLLGESDAAVIEIKQPEPVAAGISNQGCKIFPRPCRMIVLTRIRYCASWHMKKQATFPHVFRLCYLYQDLTMLPLTSVPKIGIMGIGGMVGSKRPLKEEWEQTESESKMIGRLLKMIELLKSPNSLSKQVNGIAQVLKGGNA
ncbi:hypothetical protein EZV62_003847 [Acer yangbiense]|uniref:Disease resistance N-terminal domain-containing protein n=1 Tax=Acer yangbiense TaxID=1000413 RepID=A0A5C7IJT4_9ROSI|nr:hypothetical protein EZV62_003847 [Acer yangbiense]